VKQKGFDSSIRNYVITYRKLKRYSMLLQMHVVSYPQICSLFRLTAVTTHCWC